MIQAEQLSTWKQIRDDMFADDASMKTFQEKDAQRVIVQKEMVAILSQYISGKIDNENFRSTFQQKTANEWDVFGLKGFSGAMFLNMLVNNIPDQISLAQNLKNTLVLPSDIAEAQEKLNQFVNFLHQLIDSGYVARRKVQPAHTPFFFSAWWHMQDMENWPIYYISSRNILSSEDFYVPGLNPIDDYFNFRETFLEITEQLELSIWDLEHLFLWCEQRLALIDEANNLPLPTQTNSSYMSEQTRHAQETDIAIEEHRDDIHSKTQLILAKIGHKLGCRVWLATNDRNKFYNGERLGDFNTVDKLPNLALGTKSQRIIELIDILWIKDRNRVIAAFEVEHSTSIYSGLLRMADLTTVSPNINFPLYIITSVARIKEVEQQLSRPTFQYLELHKRCGFFSYDALFQQAENIMLWASDPSVIDKLAQKVPDNSEED